MPVRVQRKVGVSLPEQSIFVGKGSVYANPFTLGEDGDAETCLRLYKKVLTPYEHHGKQSSMADFFLSVSNISAIQQELKGKDLACWCPLDSKHCHADVLLDIANKWPEVPNV